MIRWLVSISFIINDVHSVYFGLSYVCHLGQIHALVQYALYDELIFVAFAAEWTIWI